MKGPDAIFREHLASGRFMLQRSRASGQHVFYPRVSWLGSDDLEWVEASGHGVVYSATTIRRKAEQGGDYNISLVQLAEGPRMMSRVIGISPDLVKIGMPVRASVRTPTWSRRHTEPVVVFFPQEAGSAGHA